MQHIETIKGRIGANSWGAEIYKNKLDDIVSSVMISMISDINLERKFSKWLQNQQWLIMM